MTIKGKIRIPRAHLKRALSIKDTKPKTVLQHIKAFSRVTTIHGFGFAGDSICKLELFVWVLMIACFCYLTGRDVILATNEYWAEHTVTSLKLQKDFVLSLNDTTLCIPIINKLNYATLGTRGVTVYKHENHFLSSIDIFDQEQVQKFLLRFENDNDVLQHFTPRAYETDTKVQTLVTLTTRMLAQIAAVEGYYSPEVIRDGYRYSSPTATKDDVFGWGFDGKFANAPKVWAFYETFKFYQRHGIGIESILNSTARLLCHVFEVRITTEYYGGSKTVMEFLDCDELKATYSWFSVLPFPHESTREDLIYACYNLRNITLKPNKYAKIQFSAETIYDHKKLNENELSDLVSYMDLSGGKRTIPVFDKNDALAIPANSDADLSIEVFGEFISESTSKSPCFQNETFTDCRGACRANYILKHCGCWPMTWALLTTRPPHAPLCPSPLVNLSATSKTILPTTTSCFYIVNERNPDEICKEQCKDLCRATIFFNFDAKLSKAVKKRTSTVNLKGKRFIYPIFNEQLKVDLNTYLSNIGGNLGLWLGASFLAITHMVVYIIRIFLIMIANKVQQRNNNNNKKFTHFSQKDIKIDTGAAHSLVLKADLDDMAAATSSVRSRLTDQNMEFEEIEIALSSAVNIDLSKDLQSIRTKMIRYENQQRKLLQALNGIATNFNLDIRNLADLATPDKCAEKDKCDFSLYRHSLKTAPYIDHAGNVEK